MRALLLVLAFMTPALAEDWTPLTSDAITVALTGRSLAYEDGTRQNFFADGRTLYRAGAGESWGKWWVADDAYCSTWPPSETPACYGVDAQGTMIRFLDAGGSETRGSYNDQ